MFGPVYFVAQPNRRANASKESMEAQIEPGKLVLLRRTEAIREPSGTLQRISESRAGDDCPNELHECEGHTRRIAPGDLEDQ